MIRLNVAAGQHHILLKTTLNNGTVVKQEQTLNVIAGRPTLWHTRTFEPADINANAQPF